MVFFTGVLPKRNDKLTKKIISIKPTVKSLEFVVPQFSWYSRVGPTNLHPHRKQIKKYLFLLLKLKTTGPRNYIPRISKKHRIHKNWSLQSSFIPQYIC